jgi:hypothetical protein
VAESFFATLKVELDHDAARCLGFLTARAKVSVEITAGAGKEGKWQQQ